MADQSITQLPVAISVTGDEQTVIVQRGVTKQVQVSLIANAVSPGKLITNVILDAQNYLVFYYSDGTTSSTGPIPGYINATINGSGHLILTLTTGGTVDCGNVVGPTGPGVATGGTTGQVLYKTSNADYATAWETLGTMASQNSNSVSITGGSITNAALQNSSITINGSTTSLGGSVSVGTVTSISAIAGTGISVTGVPITTSGSLSITNTAPDQIVTLTGGTGISTSGTYPNFTISNTSPSSGGTVTSVSGTGTVNGITLTGTVTSSGSLTLGGTLGSIANSQLSNSTISGVSLGGNLFNLTAGTGVSFNTGTTYNGSAAITINATGTGGTVTSVAALTLGTTGTDLSSTVANSTTTPVITLNVPTASATNRGALSAADWTTFNSKAPGTVFTANYVPYGQGTSTLNQSSNLQFTGTNLLLNQSYDQGTGVLQVTGQSTFNGAVTDKSLNLQGGNNLQLYSQVFSNAVWTLNTGTSITSSTVTAPNGTSTGTALTENSSTAVFGFYNTGIVLSAGIYTFSIYLQPSGRTAVTLFLGAGNAVFNLTSTGSVTSVTATYSATITQVGSWYRCTITTPSLSAGTYYPTPRSGDGNAQVGINAVAWNAWGAQLELGTVASAYTPTTTAAITTTNNISVPSGQVLVQGGSASLPAYSFVGQANYGLNAPSSTSTALSAGGFQVLTASYLGGTPYLNIQTTGQNIQINNAGFTFGASGSYDATLVRDSANTLAQRNSTNAQTFRLYNTYTDASNYERLSIDWSTTANTATIVTQNAGTGSARTLAIGQDLFVNSVRVGLGGGSVSSNTAVGNSAMAATATGTGNVGVGQNALRILTSGSSNTAIGSSSLSNFTTGFANTAVGQASLYNSTTAGYNVGIGYYSLLNNTTGNYSTAIGTYVLQNNTTAPNLTAIGFQALVSNTTNVATLGTITGGSSYTNGTYTGVVMTLSSGSTALTYPTATIVVAGGAVTTVTITSAGAGFKDTTTVLTAPATSIGGTGSGFSVPVASLQSGTGNVAVGYQAGSANTTGTDTTYLGYQAGFTNSTGARGTFIGSSAGRLNTTGNNNIAIGSISNTSVATLGANTTGSNNVALGNGALGASVSGNNSTAVGYASLIASTSANNTAYGSTSLNATTSGGNNTAIGYQAGSVGANANTTGSNNTYLGYQTVGSANNNTNETVIGYNAVGLGSNTTVIGNSSTTLTKAFGVIVGTNYTVATLPSASTSGVGARAFVTDALAPSFGLAVTGGGAVPIPVYSTGSAWNVG